MIEVPIGPDNGDAEVIDSGLITPKVAPYVVPYGLVIDTVPVTVKDATVKVILLPLTILNGCDTVPILTEVTFEKLQTL